MYSVLQLGTKRWRTVFPKKSHKSKQNKTYRFFNSFSQNSGFAQKFFLKEIFILHEFYDSLKECLREKNLSVDFDFIEQLVNIVLKNLSKELKF